MSSATTPGNPGGETKIKQVCSLYNLLGDDPQLNVRMIVQHACILMQCACALYHSAVNGLSIIEAGPEFRLPLDLQTMENDSCLLCQEIALGNGSRPHIYTDFALTPNLAQNPLVSRLGFRSGLGYPVRHGGQVFGGLCFLDLEPRQYTDGELCLGDIIARTLAVEEERRTDPRAAEAITFGQQQRRLSLRLEQARKMEAIATLASGIAHQFNNALAVILGNLEMIQLEGLADSRLKRFVTPINQASQKMVDLTSQLLAYARGGKFQTQIVSAHRFVQDTVKLVNHSIAPNVELQLDLEENTDFIEVDTTQMQMLLAAVFSNASEATEKEGVIRVTLKNIELDLEEAARYAALKPGRHVLLQIADTGKGMEKQTLSRVFEPFFTTKFQGRGLGLAAVYGIVKMHGGYVYVDSEPDHGTTVSIYLPGIKRIDLAAPKPRSAPAARSGTALIVEDEPLVLEINRAIVERLGYNVLEASTGREAVTLARTHPGNIDLALLDVILPDMAANQIYPQLMEARPELKVIVCSGFSLDGPAREILNMGADRFLSKPFSVAALSSALDEIFKQEQSAKT